VHKKIAHEDYRMLAFKFLASTVGETHCINQGLAFLKGLQFFSVQDEV